MRTIKKSLFPIIALCAVIGLLVTACKDEDDPAPPASTTFTVAFNSNGGSSVASKTGVASGATIEAPTTPTKEGFDLEGWYKDADFEDAWVFATDTVTANITLYAKWTTTEVPATYTVTFDTGESGLPVDSITGLASGATINEPTPPPTNTKSYLIFAGWYKESTFENEWDFSTDTVTANTILYAQWDDIRTELTVETENEAVDAEATDTTADVEFAFDGTEITGLTEADFTVGAVQDDQDVTDDTEAAITEVTVDEGTVSVTITFKANTDTTNPIVYTVGIDPDSEVIKGDSAVTVTQAAAD
ncbi:hypothetical protein PilKf_01195 [Pillotina sp. SPG140]|jgi:uncharacterized repeat protein (TIGR02543 family)